MIKGRASRKTGKVDASTHGHAGSVMGNVDVVWRARDFLPVSQLLQSDPERLCPDFHRERLRDRLVPTPSPDPQALMFELSADAAAFMIALGVLGILAVLGWR
jgi:hypothetical protein